MRRRKLLPGGQRITVTGLVVLLVLVAGLAVAQNWPGVPGWVVVGAMGLAALLGGVGPLWLRWREQRAAGAGVVRRSLSTTDKTVADLSLDNLRVHTAVVDVPYLPRAAKEREIADHLRERRPVLIVGPSMVGKTRLAAAVVGQVLPDKTLLLPDTPTALGDLDKADIFPRDQVIWLDDLDRFFTGGGMSAGLVQRLSESNWLVATLRAHEWDRFQPTDQLRPLEWDVLRLFTLVTLDRQRDRPTEEDLRRAVPDPDIRERIARTGIGEYVGAASRVRDQLTVGEYANPLGYALVTGAADWSLVGITRPVPAALLPRLASARLTGRRRAELGDDGKYRIALEWATREINPTVSLLEPDDGTYRVYDYALDQIATTNRTVPPATWQLVVDEAHDEELVSVGYQAMVHHDLLDIAEQAWRKAAATGDTNAMYNLGVLLEQHGDEQVEAERWFRQGTDAGHTGAMFNLAMLLAERGEQAEAEHWFREGADAGDTRAMYNLAGLLAERGEQAEAEHWYRHAADAGHDYAMVYMGVRSAERGEVAEAERWYRQAADAGDTLAMYNLGVLLEQRGAEQAEAEGWFRQAADGGHTGAMFSLGQLLLARGEQAEAEHWFHQAANAGHTYAMAFLGALLAERGEQAEAERWLRQGANAGNTRAMYNLGVLLKRRGEQVEAEEWLRKASSSDTRGAEYRRDQAERPGFDRGSGVDH